MFVPPSLTNCPNDGSVMISAPQIGGALSEKYEIIGELGRGGIGIVYKAKQRYLDKLCAIKMLLTEKLSPDQIARFHQEAVALSKLRHPNLISLIDFGVTEENVPYMVMDFIDGSSLTDLIRKERALAPDLVVEVVIQLAKAMSYAHAQGVLHRDLKPGNVIIVNPRSRTSMSAHVLDFGIAKLTEEKHADASLTKTGDVFGSPLYMSPEQAQGKNVDARTDVYSLGCLMFEALAGRPPFTSESTLDVIMQKLQEAAPDLSKLPGKKISPALASIVSTALQRNPDKRFRDMRAFERSLNQWRSTGIGVLTGDYQVAIGLVAAIVIAVAGCLGFIMFVTSSPQPSGTAKDLKVITASPMEADALKIGGDSDTVAALIQNEFSETLIISSKAVEDNDIKGLQSKYGLRRLVIQGWDRLKPDISDRALDYFVHLPLREVTLKGAKGVTDEGMKKLASMDSLDTLNLQDINIDDAGVSYLKPLSSKLKALSLEKLKITDTSAATIANFSNLMDLSLDSCHYVTGQSLGPICKLRKLVSLTLSDTSIKLSDLGALKQLPRLKVLHARAMMSEGNDVAIFTQLPELVTLDLSDNSQLTGDGLLKLAAMKNLRQLSTARCRISPRVYARFHDMRPDVDLDHTNDGKMSVENLHWDGLNSIK